MAQSRRIKVLVADDHKLFRTGLLKVLNEDKELFVIGEAEDGADLVEKYFRLRPDIILLDISMPKLTGTQALKKIIEKDPLARALFLSMNDGEEYIYHAHKAGGLGLINKNILEGELYLAIRTVYEGNKYFGPEVNENELQEICEKFEGKATNFDDLMNFELSQREEIIVRFVAAGKTSNDIAEELRMSKRTVDFYRSAHIQKLGLNHLSEFMRFAYDYVAKYPENN